MAEFEEIPDDEKLLQLLKLIDEGLGGEGRDDDVDKLKEQFQKILHSLPSVETVTTPFILSTQKISGEQVG